VGKFGELTCFEHLAEKYWQMNKVSQKVITTSRNLEGFSLANHGRFAKFAELSPHQTFLLYGNNFIFSDKIRIFIF